MEGRKREDWDGPTEASENRHSARACLLLCGVARRVTLTLGGLAVRHGQLRPGCLLAGRGCIKQVEQAAARGWAPPALVDAIAAMSFLTRFEALSRGVIELRDLIFFFSLMAFWLFVTTLAVDAKKAG